MDPDILSVVVGLITGAAGFVGGQYMERRHYNLTATAFVSDYFRDLRGWASEAIEVLSEAAYNAPGRHDMHAMDASTQRRCRHRLSALVDRGRLFIPNIDHEATGTNKPLAYRGIRPPALDLLIAGEQLLSGNSDVQARFPSLRAALVEVKRSFVSEMQEFLDPRAQNRQLASLLKQVGMTGADGLCALDRLAHATHEDFSRVEVVPTR